MQITDFLLNAQPQKFKQYQLLSLHTILGSARVLIIWCWP